MVFRLKGKFERAEACCPAISVTMKGHTSPQDYKTAAAFFSWISWMGLGLAGESVKEGHVGEHAILILGVAKLSEQLLDIVLGHLITEVAQDVVELSQHHGAVAVFVVQLQQLQVVSVGSLGVGRASCRERV